MTHPNEVPAAGCVVIYDGHTGQGCHVISCLMESNKRGCVVRGEVAGAGRTHLYMYWVERFNLSDWCHLFYGCWLIGLSRPRVVKEPPNQKVLKSLATRERGRSKNIYKI